MSWVMEEFLPFGFQNVNEFFSVFSHKLASNGRTSMKLILSIYDQSVMMHVKLRKMSLDVEKLLPFECLNINEFRVMHMHSH